MTVRPAIVRLIRRGCWLVAAGALLALWPGSSSGEDRGSRRGDASRAASPDAGPEAPEYTVVAGTIELRDGRKARKVNLAGIGGVAVGEEGDLYFSEVARNVVRRVDPRKGRIETIAGDGSIRRSEATRATETGFLSLGPVALSPDETSLYFAQSFEGHLYRVDLSSGELSDLGAPPYGFGQPASILVEADEILVADRLYGQIWRLRDGSWSELIDRSQIVRGGIRSIVRDGHGGLFISAFFSYQVLRWDSETGLVEPYAGIGEPGRSPEGELAREALIGTPDGLALGEEGDLYFSDMSNNRICRIDRETGRLWTAHGSPDDGSPSSWSPASLTRDDEGRLWFSDVQHNRVLRIEAGRETFQVMAGGGSTGDGGPATQAILLHPGRIAVNDRGELFISEALHHRVRKVDLESGRIATVAGTGAPGYNGDGIPGTEAQLNHPGGILPVEDVLYIGDYYNNRVRAVDLETGIISTLAGTGLAGERGDGGPGAEAQLINPHALTLDEDGRLLVASAVTPTIRRIDLEEGTIDSVQLDPQAVPPESVRIFYGIAGSEKGFFLADGMRNSVLRVAGGEVADAVPLNRLNYPMDVAIAPSGQLFICDTRNNRVVKWTGEALEVVVDGLGRPRSIAFDQAGNLYIADTFNNRVLKLPEVAPAPPTEGADAVARAGQG